MDLLFSAFQHSDQYTLKDLVNITQQPVVSISDSISALYPSIYVFVYVCDVCVYVTMCVSQCVYVRKCDSVLYIIIYIHMYNYIH